MSRQEHFSYLKKEEHLRSKKNFDKFLKIHEKNEKISQEKFKEIMEKQKTLIHNLNQKIDNFMAKSPPLSCLKKEQKLKKFCHKERRQARKRIAHINVLNFDENSKRIWTITGRIEAKDSIQNSKKANLHFFLQCLLQYGNSENHHYEAGRSA